MKVADLKPGIAVRTTCPAIINYRWHDDDRVQLPDRLYYIAIEPMRRCPSWAQAPPLTLVYLESLRNQDQVHGTRLHHWFLVNGQRAMLTGWEVRYLVPV
jgi:hypothetical protein